MYHIRICLHSNWKCFAAIFNRLRTILHEGQIEQRTQYMIEVMFAIRKDGFKVSSSIPGHIILNEGIKWTVSDERGREAERVREREE